MEVKEVEENLKLRSGIERELVETSEQTGRGDLLGAGTVVESNLTLHRLLEREIQEGEIDYEGVFEDWCNWLAGVVE